MNRCLNASVLAFSASSDSDSRDASMALMRATVLRYCLRRRSLRLPKILVRKLKSMGFRQLQGPTRLLATCRVLA